MCSMERYLSALLVTEAQGLRGVMLRKGATTQLLLTSLISHALALKVIDWAFQGRGEAVGLNPSKVSTGMHAVSTDRSGRLTKYYGRKMTRYGTSIQCNIFLFVRVCDTHTVKERMQGYQVSLIIASTNPTQPNPIQHSPT